METEYHYIGDLIIIAEDKYDNNIISVGVVTKQFNIETQYKKYLKECEVDDYSTFSNEEFVNKLVHDGFIQKANMSMIHFINLDILGEF